MDCCQNGLSFPARAQGRDVIILVITAGGQRHEHLKILKRLATGAESLRSDNHVLPMLEEFGFQDIVFGIFPRVAVSLDRAICSWPKNSVEDVVYMFMEALEVSMDGWINECLMTILTVTGSDFHSPEEHCSPCNCSSAICMDNTEKPFLGPFPGQFPAWVASGIVTLQDNETSSSILDWLRDSNIFWGQYQA